jgi:hypothetical protein
MNENMVAKPKMDAIKSMGQKTRKKESDSEDIVVVVLVLVVGGGW